MYNDKTKPQLALETPNSIDDILLQDIQNLFNKQHKKSLHDREQVIISVRMGTQATWLQAQVGDSKKADVFELFVRSDCGGDLDGGLGLLIDYLDGALTEFFDNERQAFFPLDFTLYRFEEHIIFARHEFRHFDAEVMADALLKKSLHNL